MQIALPVLDGVGQCWLAVAQSWLKEFTEFVKPLVHESYESMIAWNSDFSPSEDVAVSFEPSCRISGEGTVVAQFVCLFVFFGKIPGI